MSTTVQLSYNNYLTMSYPSKSDDNLSGHITLDADKVIWHNEDLVFLQINLNEVVVIGEYTNSNGPWFDDWFITFITKDYKWHSIPWYARNIEELTQVLSIKFSQQLKESLLTGSTNWKSIVRFLETIA